MAYRYDNFDNAIVLDGFENGIADSPYSGIADIKNVNIVTIPGEASVGFSTSNKLGIALDGNIGGSNYSNITITASGATSTFTFSGAGNLENYQAVKVSASTISGLPASGTTVYWIKNIGISTSLQLTTDYKQTSTFTSGGAGTASISTVNLAQPKYMAQSKNQLGNVINNFVVDSFGQVWSDIFTTNFTSSWTYTGNGSSGFSDSSASGNGLVYLSTVNSSTPGTYDGWLFLFNNSSIDYMQIISASANPSSFTWNYGWNPLTGTNNNTAYLKTAANQNINHEAFFAPDSKVYYCDSYSIGKFYQTDISISFNPLNTSTYTYTSYSGILPISDIAQSLTYLGTNILIGGSKNIIYVWDTFDTAPINLIILPENKTSKMITVNTNAYLFTGNRGRIYITNGSQAQLFKKIPDHISGTVEPYFTWGGAVFNKNQLYFSMSVTDNAGNALSGYGGIWAISLDSQALRLTNKLSYKAYSGFATCLISKFGITGEALSGAGLYAGWDNGNSGFGIDGTSSTPYTSSTGTTSIDFDLIPIGTFNKPRNFGQVEYRLSKPMVSGESISINYRTDFSQAWTSIGTDSTVGNFSNSFAASFKNAQWIQIQAVMSSTATNPSYVRLKEIRLTGINQV